MTGKHWSGCVALMCAFFLFGRGGGSEANPGELSLHILSSTPPYAARIEFRQLRADPAVPTVRVFLDGEELTTTDVPGTQPGFTLQLRGAAPDTCRMVYAIDVSRSLDTTAWTHAKTAARDSLDQLARECEVLLLVFGNRVEVLVPFTKDRTTIASAVAGLAPTDSRTRLHDALFTVLTGASATVGASHVLLITDGIDDGSSVTAGEVLSIAAQRDIRVTTLDVSTKRTRGIGLLERLASVSKGRSLEASGSMGATGLSDALTGGSKHEGLLLFEDGKGKAPAFRELTVEVAGAVPTRASQVFFAQAASVAVGIATDSSWSPPWTVASLVILTLLLIAFLAVFRFLRFRGQAPPANLHADLRQDSAAAQGVPASIKLRDVRARIAALVTDLSSLDGHVLDYGNQLEQKMSRWRSGCHDTARRAVAVLQSCWLLKDSNSDVDLVYHELVGNLKSIGLQEISPRVGEEIADPDPRYVILNRAGAPPYRVSRVVSPGYYFAPRIPWTKDTGDEVVLQPAEVEIEAAGFAAKAPVATGE